MFWGQFKIETKQSPKGKDKTLAKPKDTPTKHNNPKKKPSPPRFITRSMSK